VPLLCIAIVALMSTMLIVVESSKPKFDVFDEAAHYDYVQRLTQLQIPSTGDKLTQHTLKMIDCTSSWNVDVIDCEDKFRDPKIYPAQGYSYESQQSPLAYLPFAGLGLLLDSDQNFGSLLPLTRLGNLFWLLVSVILLVVISRQNRKLSSWQLFILASATFLSPVVLHAFATINNDALGIAFGLAFIVIQKIRFRSPKSERNWLLTFGIGLGLAKATFLVLPGSLLIVMIYERFFRKKPEERVVPAKHKKQIPDKEYPDLSSYSIVNLITILIGGCISVFGFQVIQGLRGSQSSGTVLMALQGFALTDYPQPGKVISGFVNNLHVFGSYSPSNLGQVLYILVIGVLLVSVMRNDTDVSILGKTVLFGMGFMAIFWVAFNFVAGGFNFDSQTRYMTIFVPLIALAIVRSPKFLSLPLVGILWLFGAFYLT
jgi:hypothetical protein